MLHNTEMITVGLSLVCLVCSAGCGSNAEMTGDHPATSPVTGVVTYNQAPVANATVTFSPENQGPGAFGRTNDEGRYTLTSFETPGDGAVPGNYIVLITKYETEAPVAAATDPEEYVPPDPNAPAPVIKPPASLLPIRYSQLTTSDLRATVKAEDNTINFELQD